MIYNIYFTNYINFIKNNKGCTHKKRGKHTAHGGGLCYQWKKAAERTGLLTRGTGSRPSSSIALFVCGNHSYICAKPNAAMYTLGDAFHTQTVAPYPRCSLYFDAHK